MRLIAILAAFAVSSAFAQAPALKTFVDPTGTATIVTDKLGRVDHATKGKVANQAGYVATYATSPSTAQTLGTWCSGPTDSGSYDAWMAGQTAYVFKWGPPPPVGVTYAKFRATIAAGCASIVGPVQTTSVPSMAEFHSDKVMLKCELDTDQKMATTGWRWNEPIETPRFVSNPLLKEECEQGDMSWVVASATATVNDQQTSQTRPTSPALVTQCHSICDTNGTWGGVGCAVLGGVVRNVHAGIGCGILSSGLWQACHWKCDHPN
jgi:hypothetical protein